MNKAQLDLYNKEVVPIITVIENKLVETNADHFMTLMALASILCAQLEAMNRAGIVNSILAGFVQQNLQVILDKKARENN